MNFTIESLKKETEENNRVYLTKENAKKYNLSIEDKQFIGKLLVGEIEKELYDFTMNFSHLIYIKEEDAKKNNFCYTVASSLHLSSAQRTLIEVSFYSFINGEIEVYLSPYDYCKRNYLDNITDRYDNVFTEREVPQELIEMGLIKDTLIFTHNRIEHGYSFEIMETFTGKTFIEYNTITFPLRTRANLPHLKKSAYKNHIAAYTKNWNGDILEVFNFEKVLKEGNLEYLNQHTYQRMRKKELFNQNDIRDLYFHYWKVEDKLYHFGYDEEGSKIMKFKDGIHSAFGLIGKVEKSYYSVPMGKLDKFNKKLKKAGNR